MRGLYALLFVFLVAAPHPLLAQQPVTQSATRPALTAGAKPASTTADLDPVFVNQLLSIFKEAAITKIDAQVSLESLKVNKGRIRLRGLHIRNFEVGLRLNAGTARHLAETLQNHYAPNRPRTVPGPNLGLNQASNQAAPAPSQWTQILEILKLGLYNRLEFSIRLRELYIKELTLDTQALDIEGALLKVGATPNDPVTGKPRSDTLSMLIDILQHTALTHIKAHAGLDKLAAQRAHLVLTGTDLEGLAINVALIREDTSA